MKYLFLILIFLSNSLFGQITHSINIGPDLGIPGKNISKVSSLGFGGSFEYVYKFSPKIGARLYTGFSRFNGKTYDGFVAFWPIRAGIQAFIYEDVIFIYADGGISNYSASTGTKQTGPSFGFGAGYRQFLSKHQFIQVSAYFNYHKFKKALFSQNYNYTWINFRVAYGLNWGRKSIQKE